MGDTYISEDMKTHGISKSKQNAKGANSSAKKFLEMMTKTVNERKKSAVKAETEMVSDETMIALARSRQLTKTPLQTENAVKTHETVVVSLEDMLQEKYNRIAYHVFDASSGYWRTRNDYPHYMLYRDNIDTEAIENWTPSGPNLDPLSPNIQRNLASIPPGSKAVIIHPKVQKRMEEDPNYAHEIMMRIETWFAFDVARNEAIIPGITFGMSQCVAIGEDGSIVNAESVGGGPRLTKSKGDDDEPSFWEMRSIRFALYMSLSKKYSDNMLLQFEQMAKDSETAKQIVSAISSISKREAMEKLFEMMEGDNLRNALGETVAGVPIECVLEYTRADVWGIV
ncbi:MAG: hypothetical protein HFE62_00245 [Firmicutes bacterium]|nr:hypothetical protein [Bacillota bacterium]